MDMQAVLIVLGGIGGILLLVALAWQDNRTAQEGDAPGALERVATSEDSGLYFDRYGHEL